MCLLQQCGSLSSQISLCLGCGVLCVLQFSKYTGLLCMIAMGKLSRQSLGPLPGTATRCCIVPGRCTAGIFFSNVRACYVLILFHYSAARGVTSPSRSACTYVQHMLHAESPTHPFPFLDPFLGFDFGYVIVTRSTQVICLLEIVRYLE